jgi:hypothetical protein
MSRKGKLISRLLERPKDFTWREARTLMSQCGFELKSGSSGSARMFIHGTSKLKIRLHEPHPRKTLLPYMISELINALTETGDIEE